MERAINILINRIRSVVGENPLSVLLYGSCTLGDFRPGWSDIDLLCLTEHELSEEHMQTLVGIRQTLQSEHPESPYFRLFEGHICSRAAFCAGGPVVYWGTSGQRIKNKCDLDPFSRIVIRQNGRILCGEDLRSLVPEPTTAEIQRAIWAHYESIREHGSKTGKSLYSAGWILDIARCLYTLKTGGVIGKTNAGEWALENGCAGDEDVMRRVLTIRKDPGRYKDDPDVQIWLEQLGPSIQSYADLLASELKK